MSRKTDAVAGGDKGTVDQYNFSRDEAKMSAFLLASATSTLKLYIHDATVYFRGTKVDFTGGLSPVMAAPAASSRIDIVSMASSSEIVITSGVEADSPVAPTAPEDDMVICEVYNKAGQVEITDEEEAGSNGYINKDLRPALFLEKHASTTDKGIVEEATKAELNAGTDLGGSGAKLVAGSSILATSIYYVQLPSSDEKDALAGTGTPNSTNKYVTDDDTDATPTADKVARFNADGEIDGVDKIKDPMTYGETIAGDTLAVPVYQDKSDNKIYACDANNTSKIEYLGFAIENGDDTDEKYVQLVGIVKGFSGLDEGEKYYVQDAVGTIGKTPGTISKYVGRAISATELFIEKESSIMVKENDVTTRTLSTSNLNATKVVETGFKPRYFEAIVILDICDGRNWSEDQSAHSGMKSVHIKGVIDGNSVYFYVGRADAITPNAIPSYNPYGSLVSGTFTPPSHSNGTTASINIVCTTSYSFYTLTLSTITATANSLVFTFVSAQSGNNCALRYGIRDVTVFE